MHVTTAPRTAAVTEAIPRDRSLDATLALLSEGYAFVGNRCRRLGTDAFETRLMLRTAVCALGADAAQMFYAPDRFTRRGAIPPTTLLLLQDRHSVQWLDGAAHRHRKAMFLSLMTPGSLAALGDAFETHWRAALVRWRGRRAVLHDLAQEILLRAACTWAGVPLADEEAERRTRELAAMIEGAGAIGPRNWRALALRHRTERWARGLVERVRNGGLAVPEGCPLAVVAHHREPGGELLSASHAAVELVNLLRPTVAVARYVVFAALAIHEHPELHPRLRAAGDDELRAFVEEVRRFYPFFPLVGGRALQPFEWRGRRFEKRDWVLLDLYGTNHDPRLWSAPGVFRPERFRDGADRPYAFVPQGGGDRATGHRCAGEDATVALVIRAAKLLMHGMEYEVPPQDLRVPLTRMPTLPRSGFVIRGIRPVARG